MNENDRKQAPAQGQDGRARHGYRNEVSWDGGKGRQPYANQEDGQQGPATAHETEGGNRGSASGRNSEQLEQIQREPERLPGEAPRQDVDGEGGVS